VRWEEDVPIAHRRAVEDGLAAALGADGSSVAGDEADLVVSCGAEGDAAGGPWSLVLHPAPAGTSGEQAGAGTDRVRPGPIVQDLSSAEADLVYAPGAGDAVPPQAWRLWRDDGGRPWPVLAARGRRVDFLPDPLRGEPPPVACALWPLFLDNLVRLALGEESAVGSGWRRQGLLDPATSRLGGAAPFPPSAALPLGDVPADRPPGLLPLGPYLLAGGLLALLALWLGPSVRRWGRTGPAR
jgi:hypothetical protein